METKPSNATATAIDEANIGKLVSYHQNGWRIGTLEAVTPENVRVKKITGGHDVTVALDDVRLVIQEPEKPKAAQAKTRNSRFQKGSGCYECKGCGKQTRSTGRGDNENVGLCATCYDKAGDENAVADGHMTQEEFDARWPAEKPAPKSGKPKKVAKPKPAKKPKSKPAKKSKAPKTYDVRFDVARIVKLYDKGKGKNVSQIAQALGYPKGHGNNRIANCLIKEGVFKGTRTAQ